MAQTKPPPHRTQRISLTKSQLRSELGAELLSLCQTVTANGKISEHEVEDLRQWLDDSAGAALPAASYLREVVERIIADRKVTRDEYRELYKAVEKVLPLEVRSQAIAARREVESVERETARAARNLEREERRRNLQIASANFMVAGVRYEGRPEIIRRHAHTGDLVHLPRDPRNRFSPNAIAVCLENGRQIGFVPEFDAERLAPLIDQGARSAACMVKILSGGRSPIPVVQARLYRADSTVDVDELARSFAPSVRVVTLGPNGTIRSDLKRRQNRPLRWLLWTAILLAVVIIVSIIGTG